MKRYDNVGSLRRTQAKPQPLHFSDLVDALIQSALARVPCSRAHRQFHLFGSEILISNLPLTGPKLFTALPKHHSYHGYTLVFQSEISLPKKDTGVSTSQNVEYNDVCSLPIVCAFGGRRWRLGIPSVYRNFLCIFFFGVTSEESYHLNPEAR